MKFYKLKEDDKLIGYYSFQSVDYKKVKLDNIFIDPKFIGRGVWKDFDEPFFQTGKK